MNTLETRYRKLNPFEPDAIHERDIWGEEDSSFCDVESIHREAFSRILTDLSHVQLDGITRARFLIGAAGTGKSHLFARLRRHLSEGQFTFVSNPPTDHWAIGRHILRKVISGMTRPVPTKSGPGPYSQLERAVYAILKRICRFPGLPVSAIHEAWQGIPPEAYYPTEEDLFIRGLENSPAIALPLHIRRVLFRVLDDDKRSLATSWLSGSTSLTDRDYADLGVRGPVENDEVPDLLKRLGTLCTDVGPIVLILDQLDNLHTVDQIREIESLLIDLKDGGQNWYVIVSLLEPKFQLWNRVLSVPFKQRFGRIHDGSAALEVTELNRPTRQESKELIERRLSSPELHAQRERDGHWEPCFPLEPATVEAIARADLSSARAVLQQASAAYLQVVTGMEPRTRRLSNMVENALADVTGMLTDDDLAVDTSLIADRISDLFDLMFFAAAGVRLEPTRGPLYREMAVFRGVDRIYDCKGTQVRVIGHDVQSGNSFPSVLSRIVDEPAATILVRDSRVPASGRATTDLLAQFQQDKVFISLSLEDARLLHALGVLLAQMYEGEFEDERTDPAPTEENILRCLAAHQGLLDLMVTREFTRLAGLDAEPGTAQNRQSKAREDAPDESPGASTIPAQVSGTLPGVDVTRIPPDGPDSMPEVVSRIMEAERWLAFDRLCARIAASGLSASAAQVYRCLTTGSLSGKVTVYPLDAGPLDAPAIIIWTSEA